MSRVHMGAAVPEVCVALVQRGTGRRVEPVVRQSAAADATVLGGHRHHAYDRGVLEIEVPVAALLEEPGEWEVEVRLTVQGVTRAGLVDDRDEAGSPSLPAPRTVGPAIVDVARDPGGPVVVRTSAWKAQLLEAALAPETFSGVVRLAPGVTAERVVAVRGDERHRALLTPDDARSERGGPRLRFDLDLPPGDATGAEDWRLRVVTDDGRQPLAWPETEDDAWLGAAPGRGRALRRTDRGHVQLVSVRDTAEVADVEVAGHEVRCRVRWLGPPVPGATLRLRSRRAQVVSTQALAGRAEDSATLRLRTDPWGLGESALPPGTYRLGLETPEGVAVPLGIGASLAARLPEVRRAEELRVRVAHTGGRPVLVLRPPFEDDEIGARAQHLLKTGYAQAQPRVDERAVYLQSYDGRWATDSPLALHHELRRSRPDLVLHWGVTSAATRVPEGGVPTLIYSREYYEVLARAKYLVTNMDLERWIRPKPGQRLLQTFHGYPSKSMGLRLWRAKQLAPSWIEGELARTRGTWDTILTPTPEMDRYYREEYAYDGPVLSHGYPRDDVLVSPEAEQVRRRTRRLLGIEEGRTAVLYAPTWRDDVATSHRSAPRLRHLDLDAAAEALGEDFVLLMRGHRFHPVEDHADAARLLDVSDYPEVNDLILAADAAVLDYSSLRFDFALTGRPMVFLVPDLDTYARGARGFLYPFEETAPGPWVGSTEEVVAQLRDLDAVRRDHRAAYDAFNARFNHLQDGRSARHVVAAFFGEAGRGAEAD